MSIAMISKDMFLPNHNYGLDGLKVILAEDDQLNIMILQKMLVRWNMEVGIAENGLIAVQMAKTGYYDLVLMDVQMPVMDGLTATREIRAFDKQIPIVVTTSLPAIEVKDGFLALGITEFAYKPINVEYLYEILLKYASKKKWLMING